MHALLGQKLDPGLSIEVKPGNHHNGVEQDRLVADQEASGCVHGHPLGVVGRPEGLLEDPGRHRQERHVLDVRVVLHGVADHVVRVVVALPPAGGDAHERRQAGADHVVEPEDVGHAAVAQVVPDARELLPEDPENRSSAHVSGEGGAANREPQRAAQQGQQEGAHLGVEAHARLEEAAPQQLLPDGAEVGDVGTDRAVGDLADKVRRQHVLVHAGGVVVGKDVGAVLPCHVLDGQGAARVLVHKPCDVVRPAVNDDPQVRARVVARHLLHGEAWERLVHVVLGLRHEWDKLGDALVLPPGQRGVGVFVAVLLALLLPGRQELGHQGSRRDGHAEA
mmetsp:Transcript_29738/g.88405  ORF Transcript_29738/g.88405 Transcript_29738/m.88405 type:complete len:336 (-) Transcript_29738:248-1255(-)